MQLIKLYSNKESFKSVVFNPKGLSIVLACKEIQNNAKSKKTYNGVGKSLIIQLIHFCLGCNKIKSFESKLRGWKFFLEFKVGDEVLISERRTEEQNKFFLNGKEFSVNRFKDELAKKLFLLDNSIKNISFRTLLKTFIRNQDEQYMNYVGVAKRDMNNWENVLNLSYLLGLDILKNLKKEQIKSNIDKIEVNEKNIKNDPIFKEAFEATNDNVDVEISTLENKIKSKNEEINNFKIADNYSSIKEDSDKKTEELNVIRNEIFLVKQALEKIDQSLNFRIDIERDKVNDFYEKAKIEIPSMIKASLNEALNFHENLKEKRKERLNKERLSLQSNLNSLDKKIEKISKERDQLLNILSREGALEELISLKEFVNNLQITKNSLEKYKTILNNYRMERDVLKKHLINEDISTKKYLNSLEGKRVANNILKRFNEIVEYFYDKKRSGFVIKNNDGINKVRFNFDPFIQHDSSTGVNEVKIFSFDWMILLFGKNHKMRSLIHDSILFSNMDPRQKASAFKYAQEKVDENKIQYIVMLNESDFTSILNELDNSMKKKIKNAVILKLTDKSETSKLLGIDVDLKY